MRVAQIARTTRCKSLQMLAQTRSRPDYERVLDALEEAGDWGELQAVQHNAERIGIANGNRMALPPSDGYYVLGLKGMECIRDRDNLRSGDWRLSANKVTVAEKWIGVAERYGWNHEAWKLNWILFWRAGRSGRYRHLLGWMKHFWTTQYALGERVRQLIMSILPQSQG